ncbi:SDO1-like protein C21C3.19 [Metarhizium anisopliae]|nr:SDO1-like protein C21C3.19 [Metarhizium anisopliae]
MTRGESTQTKIHYKGDDDDFLVFVEDVDQYKQWLKGDTSIPLAQFVSSFKIFLTHRPPRSPSVEEPPADRPFCRQGAQGTYDAAPKNVLYSEFGTDDDDEVIKKILKGGSMQTMEMPGRQGVTNESMSSMKTH